MRWRTHLVAILLSAIFVGVAAAAVLDGSFGIALLVVSPGVSILRWFPRLVHPVTRAATMAALIVPNALIYWPVVVFFLDLRREGPAFRRAVTRSHLFAALGVGAAACAIAFEASRRWPVAFGILATPLDVFMPIVTMLHGPRRPRSLVMWRLGGGLFAYTVIAFLAFYRFRWRHSGNAELL